MNIFSKNLLNTAIKMVTLTVITSPAGATCTLTYNGQAYTTKTLEVEAGSTINYSISYNSDYISAAGSWIITEDTTKSISLSHKTCYLVFGCSNSYDDQKLSIILIFDGNEETMNTTSIIRHKTSIKSNVTYSYSVSHPDVGSYQDSGNLNNYGHRMISVKLKSDGTWNRTVV